MAVDLDSVIADTARWLVSAYPTASGVLATTLAEVLRHPDLLVPVAELHRAELLARLAEPGTAAAA